MPVQLLDSRWVLIPHYPDWSTRPEWFRLWDSEVASAESGKEFRVTTRVRGRVGLRFKLTPYDHAERAELLDRLAAVKKAGEAAVPYWGRGCEILSVAGSAITLRRDASFENDFGDWMFIRRSGAANYAFWEVFQLSSLSGTSLNATAPLSGTYAAGDFVWPVLKGKAEFNALALFSGRRHDMDFVIRETETRAKPVPDYCAIELGGLALTGSGGDSFECYTVASPVTESLGSGAGFTGAWLFVSGLSGPVAWDYFEDYSSGQESSFNKGHGWALSFTIQAANDPFAAVETFEDYEEANPVVDSLNSGTGFSGAWAFSGTNEPLAAMDDMEDYADAQSSGFDQGSGFTSGWSLSTTVITD